MDQMMQRRDRLLRQTARVYAGAALFASFACLSTPDALGTLGYLVALPIYALIAVVVVLLDSRHALPLVAAATALAVSASIVLTVVDPGLTPSSALAVLLLTGAVAPGAAILLVSSPRGWLAYGATALVAAAVGAIALAVLIPWWEAVIAVLIGVALATAFGFLVTSSVAPAMLRLQEIGRAHRAERQASELEAQRRHGARLLHDTVLATLTLLAHSGVGVSNEALRIQARNDAQLLRQLRLGEPLLALPEAGYQPELAEESTLGTTLDSVKQRFQSLGLEVNWHGTGRVLLPPGVLDAFLFAISECLENVRRHAGVPVAHVTITEDEHTVRAMVTDAGIGFQPDAVGSERLGLKDSVIGRLAELGGGAKLFSSPGSGTTVLLEVPR